MKTDRYKDLEHKFFEGEKLSPEEETLLRTESENPYFSFLKEEKQEELDISFDDFLSKVDVKEKESVSIIALPAAKPRFGSGLKTYWMAASLIMFMGIMGGYLFINEETGEITKPVKPIVKQDTEIERSAEQTLDPGKIAVTNPASEITVEPTKVISEQKTSMAENVPTSTSKHAVTSPASNKVKPVSQSQISDNAYNPNYVIINGKPVYNEQEAISLAEDAFNYLASNVSQTVDHAQSVKNLSLDFK